MNIYSIVTWLNAIQTWQYAHTFILVNGFPSLVLTWFTTVIDFFAS